MNKSFLFCLLCCFMYVSTVTSQELTGQQLLEKAIQYHDPNGNWETFNGTLNVTMETPNNAPRVSTIKINLPEEYFYVKASRDQKTTEYTVEKDTCLIAFNGKTDISDAIAKKNNLSCDRANLYKNYYTYLYGLPMKLKDAGTVIDPKVTKKTFKGKQLFLSLDKCIN